MSGYHQMSKVEETTFRLDTVRNLGNRITEIRAEKGMKQKDVAEKLRLGLPDITITQYENGRQEIYNWFQNKNVQYSRDWAQSRDMS